MIYLAITWLVLSIYILFKWTYRMLNKTIVWWDALFAIQTPIIGMVVFPKYLHASLEVQEFMAWLSIGLMGVSFLLFFLKFSRLNHKNRR